MNIPILTFFNNKGGVGKTSLVYHVAWMLSESGFKVLVCDLDPQANLTSAFLTEATLEKLWGEEETPTKGTTIFRCVEPVLGMGDLGTPVLQKITPSLSLLPGDLGLSGFEDTLSAEWPAAMGSNNHVRPFRILTAFWSLAQTGAKSVGADVILFDVGPNLGAINRSALIATDHVIVPLGADLFSLQGLRNLGPTLTMWRRDWRKRLDNWPLPTFPLPKGQMAPLGYVVQQHSVRLDRPVKAYDKWIRRIPRDYERYLGGDDDANVASSPSEDPACLATMKHFRSLVPMAQESKKPIFKLTNADGAIGGHAAAVSDAKQQFSVLSTAIAKRANLTVASQ
jgi:chromosome partitioning protein